MPPVTVSMQVKGAKEFADLVGALKAAGRTDLKNELYKGLGRATKPLKPLVQQSARKRLPRRGGLAEKVAKSRITVKKTTAGNKIGVRLVGSNRIDIRSMDAGRLRWPVFPKPNQSRQQWKWHERHIRPGWWSEPLGSTAPRQARQEVIRAVGTVKDKLDRATR